MKDPNWRVIEKGFGIVKSLVSQFTLNILVTLMNLKYWSLLFRYKFREIVVVLMMLLGLAINPPIGDSSWVPEMTVEDKSYRV